MKYKLQPKENVTESKRAELLDGAKQCVCQDRNSQYGEPEDNFKIIADFWADYLDTEVTPHDVGMMMTLFKIGRIKSGGVKDDNYIDAAGYIVCAGEIALKEDKP